MTATMTPTVGKAIRSGMYRNENPTARELLDELPAQGGWTIGDYDFFSPRVPRGTLEFSHGRILLRHPPEWVGDDAGMLTAVLEKIESYLPRQGAWTLEDYDYFAGKLNGGAPLEFSHGVLVRKSMPLKLHTLIVRYLRRLLEQFVDARDLGYVFSEGAELRYELTVVRLPDVVYISRKNFDRSNEKGFEAADIAMEVVSESNRDQDLINKRRDYALCGIPEYWIVDPKGKQVTVLKLKNTEYVEHGVFKPGEKATSCVLEGFEVDVTESLAGR